MQFRTPVIPPVYPFKMDYSTPSLWMGSCFTTNMGDQMESLRFPVCVNPFGAVYNPVSLVACLQLLLQKKQLTPDDLFFHRGLWNSFHFHSSFSLPNRDDCLGKINERLASAAHFLANSRYLFITLGTAYAFYHQPEYRIVNNCHQLPTAQFKQEALSVAGIVAQWEAFIPLLLEQQPALKVVFSVSPIRHLSNGAHGNQLSKSILLLSVDEIIRKFPEHCFYFPSYEYVLDDLRDYRFYADDMCHPSPLAITYIWKQFEKALLSPHAQSLLREVEQLNKARAHRPFNEQTEQHQVFLWNLEEKERNLTAKLQGLLSRDQG